MSNRYHWISTEDSNFLKYWFDIFFDKVYSIHSNRLEKRSNGTDQILICESERGLPGHVCKDTRQDIRPYEGRIPELTDLSLAAQKVKSALDPTLTCKILHVVNML